MQNTTRQLDTASYYGYLLLYNLAYMFDDSGIRLLLSQSHLQAQLPIPETLPTFFHSSPGSALTLP